MIFKASYKVTFKNGRDWKTTVHDLDEKDALAAGRAGKRKLRSVLGVSVKRIRCGRVCRDLKRGS